MWSLPVLACIPWRITTLSPRCRPLGQPATERSAHSSRLSEENSSSLFVRTVSPQTCRGGKLYILLQLGAKALQSR